MYIYTHIYTYIVKLLETVIMKFFYASIFHLFHFLHVPHNHSDLPILAVQCGFKMKFLQLPSGSWLKE